MAYLSIDNLYKDTSLLMMREVYALEKVHGTSTHIAWNASLIPPDLRFFAGGCEHAAFVAIFDAAALVSAFQALGHAKVTVYGEGYGGKMQGMSHTYGDKLRFIAFDVLVGETWLDVPDAADVVKKLGLEFVPFERVSTKLEDIDRERDRGSLVAIRNGMGAGHLREGVVLRPLTELVKKNGHRLIAKHKRAEFRETRKTREVDPEKIEVLRAADAIAYEWVTDMRLAHVIDKVIGSEPLDMKRTSEIIKAMIADIQKESAGEIAWGKDAYTAIGKRTAALWKGKVMQIEAKP